MVAEDLAVTIPQAAEYLQVTDKTIRNYITRGILRAGKWNGSWRVDRSSLRDVYWKRTGMPPAEDEMVPPVTHSSGGISMSGSEFALLERRSGKLEAAEALTAALTAERAALQRRVEQLEASAASAWTEARSLRSDLEDARRNLAELALSSRDTGSEKRVLQSELQRLKDEILEVRKQYAESESVREGLAVQLGELVVKHRRLEERLRVGSRG